MARAFRSVYAPAPMKFLPLLVALIGLTACKPEIGDNCSTALDCSATGNRLCDMTQPGGYCTIPGCEKGTCPDEAVCVRFRPEDPRLAVAYCMYECEDSGDCRNDEGYRCMSGDSFGRNDEVDALVLDGASKKFCAQRAVQLMSAPELDGGASGLFDDASMDADASLSDASAADASLTDAAVDEDAGN